MRFVARSAQLCLGNYRNAKEAIQPAAEIVVDGKRRTTTPEAYVVSPSVPIQFSRMGLTQADIDAALAHWRKWPGHTLELDEVTPTSPVEKLGVWDSVEWQRQHGLADTDRVAAEQLLLTSTVHGIEYIQVEATAAKGAAPWATYDTTHHNRIPTLAAELGCVDDAIAYEKATKNRDSVLAALDSRRGDGTPSPDGELIAA